MLPNKRILHLSHTDIRYDSRILKEMICVAKLPNVELFGIGVEMDEGNKIPSEAQSLNIRSINLAARKLTFLWPFLRHLFTIIELAIRIAVIALRFRPEIIHCHDVVVLPPAVLLKVLLRAKLVYDAHELESNRNGLTPFLSKATLVTERMLWPHVDFLITVSSSIERWYFQHLGEKSSKIILNSPVIATATQQDCLPANYLRTKFSIPDPCKVFIYVGILGKGRGIELFLEIFSRIKKAHLVFLGYGVLADLIEGQSKIHHNIHYHPAVNHNQVVSLVKSADVGLCLIENISLSDYYCLPNKLFEYIFAGVPVIASQFPDIAETVRQYTLGVCCDEQMESIERAVQGFITGEHTVAIDQERIHDLSWEVQDAKLTRLYEQVLAEIRA